VIARRIAWPLDKPLDCAAPRNPRILLLTDLIPWDRFAVTGAYQRLRRDLLALDRLGPVDVAFFRSEHRPWQEAEIAHLRTIVPQVWPQRGMLHFVAPDEVRGPVARVSDLFWMLRGFVGFDSDEPTMRTCRRPQVKGLEHILRLSQPDLVFAYGVSMTVPFLRANSERPPLIVDFFDLESIRIERFAKLKRTLIARCKLRFATLLARRAERRASAIAHAALVCSEVDQATLNSICPDAHVVSVPNSGILFCDMPLASQPIAIFVGTAWYNPNREAILWLANQIWPHVRRAVPDARLIIAGERTNDLGVASPQLGIETLGFVEDLTTIYRATMLALCPVRRGSGTRIKIIEASLNGRPVVSTSVGAEGLPFIPNAEILIEDDAQRFAETCIRLFRDPERASLIGRAASHRARSNFLEERTVDLLCAICSDVLREHRGTGAV
jgi:glycosyltransferase involved in cell wall biosynthesis